MHKRKKPRVLFILKLRQTSSGQNYTVLKSSGLLNSATFVKDFLLENNFDTKLVQVTDNNGIDREVTTFKPDVVIIEALWVIPEKFDVLKKLHPEVKWIIRVHSEIPFLASEGIAIDWINKYLKQDNVFVSFNSLQTHLDFLQYTNEIDPRGKLAKKLMFLPNYYPVLNSSHAPQGNHRDNVFHVGCFGAIRPMKNHLIQAFAAVKFAEKNGLRCKFHINAGRVERGDEVLKNLRNYFLAFNGKHELVEHEWLERPEFLALISSMDIGLQVSLSETFNIVSADFVTQGVPIVTSTEIDWMPAYFTADATSVDSIVNSMQQALWYNKYFWWLDIQRNALKKYVKQSGIVWLDTMQSFD